jgi:RNase adapter protein RapZ
MPAPAKRPSSDCVVVTGLSGAGRTVVLRALEDLGFFCVDNLPLPLLPSLTELYRNWKQHLTNIAVGVDVRTGMTLQHFRQSLELLRRHGFRVRVLFLDADNATLIRRFSETRRRHPLGGSVSSGVRRERKMLSEVKAIADRVVDTSRLTPTEMKELLTLTLGLTDVHRMSVSFVSFGYKHGLPMDADMVLDVRFLPNPNYIPRFRFLTGKKPAVAQFVLRNPVARRFVSRLKKFLPFLLKNFAKEGKSYLTVAVGCTGGRHRSVAIAEALAEIVRRRGWTAKVIHRDSGKS